MAVQPTRVFREEHAELMEHLGHVRGMMDALRDRRGAAEIGVLTHAVDFFKNLLKPHAQWEEEHLYPAMDDLIRRVGRPTETMSIDHRYLVAKMDEFEREVEGLAAAVDAGDEEKAARADQVRRLGYQLEALLELHFRKEEEVYLEAMDRHMTPDEVGRILATAHGAAGHRH